MMAPMSAPTERSVRVSTLELFFDLVFVFTVTQLTGVLVDGGDRSSVVQVVVMLAVIWWIYDGYAWLTNAIATDRVRFRLLLIGGMGGFLVIALAVPHAYDGNGLSFGLGYLAVVLLHSSMYVKGTSLAEAAAILRIVPFNLAAAAVVLVGGALGGDVQWLLWAAAAALLWATGWFTSLEGLLIIPEHFVERHGLVVIIALGESIVVIGAGAAGLPLDARLVLVALLSLTLSASLWWLYFSDETDVEHAMRAVRPEQRARLALVGYGYWHFGLLLGVVGVAAGLKKAIGNPSDPLDGWIATELAVGTALFALCDVGFRRTMGLTRSPQRLVAVAAAVATIPIGTEIAAAPQVAALAGIVAVALLAEALPPGRLQNQSIS